MKKRIFPALLAALLLVLTLAPGAAATQASSGTCGEGITWSYANYTLTITGSGEMADGSPWEAHKDRIETVIFTGGITKIPDSAFENYDSLEKIYFGDALVEIGKRAFYDCNDIVEIRLPKTFKRFGEECFRNCQSLERVICEGGMPSFKSSCLYTGNYIAVFYPPNNPWAYEYYKPLIDSYGGLLGVMMASEEVMSQGFALQAEDVPQETQAETRAAETEPPVETQAPTLEAEDVPQETQKPVVVAEDVPETTAAAATVPAETLPPVTQAQIQPTETGGLDLFTEPTEAAQEPQAKESFLSSSWMGLVMIAGVLTFLLAGAMIFRNNRHKGGRYGE